MATLNVKNVPDRLYATLQTRAKLRSRSVSQEVIAILAEVVDDSSALSVLELQGLGKELWRDTDATEHVRRERDAWD